MTEPSTLPERKRIMEHYAAALEALGVTAPAPLRYWSGFFTDRFLADRPTEGASGADADRILRCRIRVLRLLCFEGACEYYEGDMNCPWGLSDVGIRYGEDDDGGRKYWDPDHANIEFWYEIASNVWAETDDEDQPLEGDAIGLDPEGDVTFSRLDRREEHNAQTTYAVGDVLKGWRSFTSGGRNAWEDLGTFIEALVEKDGGPAGWKTLEDPPLG